MEKQMDWKLEVRDLSWGVRRERGSKLMILQRVKLGRRQICSHTVSLRPCVPKSYE